MKKISMKKFFKKAVAAVTALAMMAGITLVPSVEAKADPADAEDTVITIYFKPAEDNEEWTWLTYTWGGTVEAKDEENSIGITVWPNQDKDMVKMTKDESKPGWYYAEMKEFADIESLIWIPVIMYNNGRVKEEVPGKNTGNVWNSAVLKQTPQLTEAYYDQESGSWYPNSEMNSEEAIKMPEVAKDEMYVDFVSTGSTRDIIPALSNLRPMKLEESDTNGDTYTLTIENVKPGDYKYRFVQDPENHAWSYQAGMNSLGEIEISDDSPKKEFTVDAMSQVTFIITVTARKGGDDYDKYAMTEVYFEDPVIKKAISSCEIILSKESYDYDGEAKEPTITVNDEKGNNLTVNTDYEVEYKDNTDAGTATVTITGTGDYGGTKNKEFRINKTMLSKCTITLPEAEDYDYTYDGTDKEPTVTVKNGDKVLVLGTDYTVEYGNNNNVGTATVTITGKGNYTGSQTIEFAIKAKEDETEASTSGEDETEASTSGEDETEASTSGEDETEASTSGEDETEASTFGEDETEQTTAEDETEQTTAEDETEQTTAEDQTEQTTAEDQTEQTTAEDQTEQTTAEDETEQTTGEESTENPPAPQSKEISSCTVTLSAAVYTYDGEAKTPEVTVKDGAKELVLDTDYTVAYKNNTKVGTATVTVTGKGNYTGTKTATFKINAAPAPVKLDQVKSLKQKTFYANKIIKMSWAKVAGATSYEVYRSTSKNKGFQKVATVKTNSLTDKKLKAGTTYYYMVCACNKSVKGAYSSTVKMVTKTAIPKVTAKAGKKQIKITWKKVTGAKGYEVSLSTKKNKGFKKVKTAKSSATSFTKKGLKKGKTYYVQVKAYNKNAAGEKVYSSARTIKVKVK